MHSSINMKNSNVYSSKYQRNHIRFMVVPSISSITLLSYSQSSACIVELERTLDPLSFVADVFILMTSSAANGLKAALPLVEMKYTPVLQPLAMHLSFPVP